MSSRRRKLNTANINAKVKSDYRCQLCGSTEYVAAHHRVPGDDTSIIVLCGKCHAAQHPSMAIGMFINRNIQPFWSNKSAASLAREFNVVQRTIIRKAKELGFTGETITNEQVEVLKNSFHKGHRKIVTKVVIPPIKQCPREVQSYETTGGYTYLHIPADIAADLGIKKGIPFVFVYSNGQLTIRMK